MKKSLLLLILFTIISISLSACGKSANPVPYPGSDYPRTYPYNQQKGIL